MKGQGQLSDAYKFACFCTRTVFALATGRIVGDHTTDHAMGSAIAEIYPPEKLVKQGHQYGMLMHAAAGAWQYQLSQKNRIKVKRKQHEDKPGSDR